MRLTSANAAPLHRRYLLHSHSPPWWPRTIPGSGHESQGIHQIRQDEDDAELVETDACLR